MVVVGVTTESVEPPEQRAPPESLQPRAKVSPVVEQAVWEQKVRRARAPIPSAGAAVVDTAPVVVAAVKPA